MGFFLMPTIVALGFIGHKFAGELGVVIVGTLIVSVYLGMISLDNE